MYLVPHVQTVSFYFALILAIMHMFEWFLKTTFCDPGPDARFRLARILFVIVLYPFNAKKN